jgi:hypothetical protein
MVLATASSAEPLERHDRSLLPVSSPRRAPWRCHFNFTGAAHIFFKGQHAAVVHNGGKAQADGFFHQLRREAVVKVQRNGHTGRRAMPSIMSAYSASEAPGKKAFGGPDDDGGVQFLRLPQGCLSSFPV